ncbi:hypothetical protein H1Q59_04265 [Holosporaceae bacterium 'Namur']|nr:hypothetical protein [Holosporaceae bacterium 'Namur']
MCRVTQDIIFPSGLPGNFKSLNSLQKEFIYEEGGAATLVYLGLLPKLYAAIDKDSYDLIQSEFKQGVYDKIFSYRKLIAMKHIKIAAEKYYENSSSQQKVILVYGGFHDFQEECDEYGFKLTEVDFVINKPFNSDAVRAYITEEDEGYDDYDSISTNYMHQINSSSAEF